MKNKTDFIIGGALIFILILALGCQGSKPWKESYAGGTFVVLSLKDTGKINENDRIGEDGIKNLKGWLSQKKFNIGNFNIKALPYKKVLIMLPDLKYSTTTREIVEGAGLDWEDYAGDMIQKKWAYQPAEDRLVFLGHLGFQLPEEDKRTDNFYKIIAIPQTVDVRDFFTGPSFEFKRVEFASKQREISEPEEKGFEKYESNGYLYYVHPGTELDASFVEQAASGVSTIGTKVVTITLDKAGTERFAKLTKENLHKQLAIIYQNKLIMAPKIQEPILEGKIEITGRNMSDEEISHMVDSFNILALLNSYKISDAGFLTENIWDGETGQLK